MKTLKESLKEDKELLESFEDIFNFLKDANDAASGVVDDISTMANTADTTIEVVGKTSSWIQRLKDAKYHRRAQKTLNRVLRNDKIIKWIDRSGSKSELLKILRSILDEKEFKYLGDIANALMNDEVIIKIDDDDKRRSTKFLR